MGRRANERAKGDRDVARSLLWPLYSKDRIRGIRSIDGGGGGDAITIGQDAWMGVGRDGREAATLRPIDSLAFATGTWERKESQAIPGLILILVTKFKMRAVDLQSYGRRIG